MRIKFTMKFKKLIRLNISQHFRDNAVIGVQPSLE